MAFFFEFKRILNKKVVENLNIDWFLFKITIPIYFSFLKIKQQSYRQNFQKSLHLDF